MQITERRSSSTSVRFCNATGLWPLNFMLLCRLSEQKLHTVPSVVDVAHSLHFHAAGESHQQQKPEGKRQVHDIHVHADVKHTDIQYDINICNKLLY